MAKVLENWDVASLYPNLVRIYGYSSRNQKDKKAYTDLLSMRIKAKHDELGEDILGPLKLTNKDLKDGLKLPLNAYTGCLRATTNKLYDNLQGFSICSTGQMLLLQLAHDLKEIPTVEIIELNTDAVMYMIDTDYVEQAHKVLQDWQNLTGLELEQDKIKKIIMRDVNNYVEIIEGKKGYDVHYKGGEFRGQHIFEWDKEKRTFHYSFKNDLENNSLTIVSEAMLKNLLFNIPVEDTINACNDPFRFQKITHLGGTFSGCILENKDGTMVELQRNNRVYAGVEKTGGMIYKVKENGSRSKLSDCPPNPIVDNAGEITIDKINKSWYIKYTKQRVSDFVRKGDIYMEDKLEKMKKDELIAMIKENNSRSENSTAPINASDKALLLQKITTFREKMRKRNFILDKELPKNLGGGEIYSIDQIYQAVQDVSLECGLDFSFETTEMTQFDLAAFKPMTGAPNHIATVKSVITFADIDTGCEKTYTMVSQGSDSIDKAVNSASTMAFRNWFTKNFTPNMINGEEIKYGDTINNDVVSDEVASKPKTPTFIPAEKKQEIVKEITSEPVNNASDKDFDEVTDLIMELRELSGNAKAGEKTMNAMLDGSISDIDLMNAKLKLQNAIADLKNK